MKRSTAKTGLFFITALFILIFSFVTRSTFAQTVVTSGQQVDGTVDGTNYEISSGVNDDVLVEIKFTISDASSTAGDNVFMSVSDQDFNLLGTLIARPESVDYITTICPSSSSPPTSYIFSIDGTPGAAYSFTPTLRNARLRQGVTQFDQTIDGPSYYYFDVTRTNAPLEITVKSDDDDIEAVLQGTYDQCPPYDYDSNSLLPENDRETAWLTFTTQGRLSLSQVDPELRTGRWYFTVFGRSQTRNKAFRLTLDYGLDYDEYYAPTLVLLFIYPVITLFLVAPPFLLTMWMNLTPWLKKTDPRNGREDEEVKIPKKTNYFPFTIICGIFFFIPALQVATRAANEARNEGDRDECYYNDFCAKPSDIFAASNNIWSNAGYMWTGLVLIIYFFFCKKVFRFRYMISRDVYVVYGVAVSIFLVGMMSLTYHICPTREMFQWDTSFMFVTAGLLLCELFRKYFHKHPRAWIPFALFALLFIINYLASLVDVTGTYNGDTQGLSDDDRSTKRYIYRACLTGFMIAVAGFVFYFVYLKPKRRWGEEKQRDWEGKEGWTKFYYKRLRHIALRFKRIIKFQPLRLIAIVLWFIIMMIIIWARPDSDLSSTLLYIMIVSFLWFLLAYLVHKVRIVLSYMCCHREAGKVRGKHSWLALILWLYLGVSTIVLWIVALIFFSILDSSDKNKTPAQSRESNDECLVWDFYDSHDIWHVIGAIGLLTGALFVFHTDVIEGPLPKDAKGGKKHKTADDML